MSDFDWTAYILFKQVSALKEQLDKIQFPPPPLSRYMPAAIGPAEEFNELLPKVKEVLPEHSAFAKSIDHLVSITEVGQMYTAGVSKLQADVAILRQTLEAFIHATFPREEKQKIGFI